MIFVHIGLPKTATTFWQHRIMRNIPDIDFLHRKIDEDSNEICRGLREYCQRRRSEAPGWNRRMSAAAQKLAARVERSGSGDLPVVISDENISLGAETFWTNEGAEPQDVAERILAFFRSLGGISRDIRIIWGIREQAAWLASRYAQSRIAHALADREEASEFCQSDFDARLDRLANQPCLDGPYLWLDYAYVAGVFRSSFGSSNLLVLPMESLVADPRRVLKDLQEFLGCSALDPIYQEAEAAGMNVANRLSVNESTWTLGQGKLTLDPALRQRIAARFAHSNREFNSLPQYGSK